ncbi:Zinc finger, RING-type [Dillenia turbinata]|uniref:Zinc finger, RING-type n=1 Tax=Dillenia turbinata TaxID=194707 RepID=A0AAN8Z172_9MAGN
MAKELVRLKFTFPCNSVETTIRSPLLDLRRIKFRDLRLSIRWDRDGAISCNEEMCSVCLVDFALEEEDQLVSQLPKCKHVFHSKCITNWVHRNQTTCPLCRSSLL